MLTFTPWTVHTYKRSFGLWETLLSGLLKLCNRPRQSITATEICRSARGLPGLSKRNISLGCSVLEGWLCQVLIWIFCRFRNLLFSGGKTNHPIRNVFINFEWRKEATTQLFLFWTPSLVSIRRSTIFVRLFRAVKFLALLNPPVFNVAWFKKEDRLGSTEIWTRIGGFNVQSANRYTMEPSQEQTLLSERIVHCHRSETFR